jgi:hypothetical protein
MRHALAAATDHRAPGGVICNQTPLLLWLLALPTSKHPAAHKMRKTDKWLNIFCHHHCHMLQVGPGRFCWQQTQLKGDYARPLDSSGLCASLHMHCRSD